MKMDSNPTSSIESAPVTSVNAEVKCTSAPAKAIPAVLDIILDRVPGLPPSMHIMPRLLRTLGDPHTDISDIADLVAFDPGLTVKLIQSCNTAALAGDMLVTDVGQAVNRLGMRCVFQVVAALAGKSVLNSPAIHAVLDVNQLWEHSVMVGLAASILAKAREADDSAAFTAGLLHESGKVVMAQAFREYYGELLTSYSGNPAVLLARERATFGFDHPEAGGRLLARGAFPEVIVASVTHQYCPEQAQDHARAAALLLVAHALAGQTQRTAADHLTTDPMITPALSLLDLDPDSLAIYRERTEEEFKFANALCRL